MTAGAKEKISIQIGSSLNENLVIFINLKSGGKPTFLTWRPRNLSSSDAALKVFQRLIRSNESLSATS